MIGVIEEGNTAKVAKALSNMLEISCFLKSKGKRLIPKTMLLALMKPRKSFKKMPARN